MGERGVLGGCKAGISSLILQKLENFNVLCASSKHFSSAVPALISCPILGPTSSLPAAAGVHSPHSYSRAALLYLDFNSLP